MKEEHESQRLLLDIESRDKCLMPNYGGLSENLRNVDSARNFVEGMKGKGEI